MQPAEATADHGGRFPQWLPAALMLVLLRIESRRFAAWLGLVGAVACGAGSVASGPALAAVIAAGGLLAVAAIGHVPDPGRTFGCPLWGVLGMRAVWPATGFLSVAAARAVLGHPAVGPLAGALSLCGTALFVSLLLETRRAEAVAATRALVGVGAAAAAAVAAQLAGSGLEGQAIAAVAVWGLASATGGMHQASAVSGGWGSSADTGRNRRPEAGAVAAMASALAAMVGCYFLAPQYAWAYAPVAVGWFVAVAVPAATPAAGSAAAVRLGRSAPGWPAFPGSLRWGARIVAAMTATLAWPAVVALLLPPAEGGRDGGPLLALAWIGGVAGLLVAALLVAVPLGRSEAARAVVLAAVALAGVTAAAKPPGLPRFWPFEAGHPARSGVEPLKASCQTSQVPQPAWSPQRFAARVESAASGAR